MSTKDSVDNIKDIIKVMNSGISFYTDAKEKVDSPSLISIFNEMIAEKNYAANKLQTFVIREEEKPESDGSFLVGIRNTYTNIIAKIGSEPEETYIDHLEEVEDKVLESIDDALEGELDVDHRAVLISIRTSMQACHDKMRDLKKATA